MFLDHLNFNEKFTYRGSLTTAPYTESLFWTVLPTIVSIKKETKDMFHFHTHASDTSLPDPVLGAQNRDTQPLNGRHVFKIEISPST